jgi:ABC-type multidrug transport system ATPase subunit
MSEEILKALVQLYAIITKQDGGVTIKEREYVIASFNEKLNLDKVKEYIQLYDELAEYNVLPSDSKFELEDKKEKLTSVKDSVKTLGLCKKINKTLTQKQKIIVLMELLELVNSDGNFTPQRMQIIDTVSTAFNIEKEEYKSIEKFVLSSTVSEFNEENILVISNDPNRISSNSKFFHSEYIDSNLVFIHIKRVDLMFMKNIGQDNITLNGLYVNENKVVLFPVGSIVKSQKGSCYYYSDIKSYFNSDLKEVKLSFNLKEVEYQFDNGAIGLRDITISEGPGKLIGIMGASGAGKTTLLNVMAGLEKPSKGEVLINGVNIYENRDKATGVIGYISQDDTLIEELTVFENLYFNAKLCFKNLNEADIIALVVKVLQNLGLSHIKHLQVGNYLNKKISGGQRKRLNIALELIREPSVLFVDEPTSGLSSRDSENVIDLLKELSLKGTLIFVVIHQPSSDIYKMFDKMLILDTGGYLIFNGHPVDAVSYFKRIALHADCEKGQCPACGNVNPEQIFNIIEEKVVDEYGSFTSQRKVTPVQWWEYYKQNFIVKVIQDIKDVPLKVLEIPSKVKQFVIFSVRDLRSKISNQQYMLLNLLEAPLLAFILAFIIRYKNDSSLSNYVFRFNENIPAYILMSIVVALFMGLSVSAEEIIKDKKILKRESFLNLSRSSYLFSKLFILFSFSAVQTLLFVLVGNTILKIQGMFFTYWFILFTTSCLANVLGLIISSAFKTAVTVYICIPLLLIPQMILSGAMFNFDKINDVFRKEGKVPVVADMMVSRWAYEALAVAQFKDNEYEKYLYKTEQVERISDFQLVYVLPELKEKVKKLDQYLKGKGRITDQEAQKDLQFIQNELVKQSKINKNIDVKYISSIHYDTYSDDASYKLNTYIDELETIYQNAFNKARDEKDKILTGKLKHSGRSLEELKNEYFNESLSDLMKNVNAKHRTIEVSNQLLPKIDPVYFNPISVAHSLDYRTHFFAPNKHFMNRYYDTYIFNILVIWSQTVLLYFFLYFDVLKRILDLFGKLSWKKAKNLNP